MFERGTDGHFIIDRSHGRIVSANVRSAELLGREVDKLIGSTIGEIAFGPCDLTREGRYDYVALRRADNNPVFVTLSVTHIDDPASGYDVLAYSARQAVERTRQDSDLIAKHSALFAAHADLETAYTQLRDTQTELESKNHDIAMLAYRIGVNELVGSIAHHLNNPLGALHSMIRSVDKQIKELPPEHRGELDRRIRRITNIAGRIESNVNAIVTAGRTSTSTRKLHAEIAAAIENGNLETDQAGRKGQS